MNRIRAICLVLTAASISGVQAGSIRMQGVAGGAFSVPVQSRKEMRWTNVIKQQYDFSCGAAAVATLLSFHYEHRVNEDQVFRKMFALGNQRQIQTAGFSMLDLKKYLDAQGLKSDGFRMTLDKFARIGVPGITMIDTNGYKHFVIIKGIDNHRILISDPALGTRVISRGDFEQQWNGAVLAAREAMHIARQNFNQSTDWRVRTEAPLGRGIDRNGLGIFTLSLPGLQEFGR